METRPAELIVHSHEHVAGDGSEVHAFTASVPSELMFFQGHFPGAPVMPAFVQLLFVVGHIRDVWPDLAHVVGSKRMKFRSPMRPGDDIRITLERVSGRNEVAFKIDRGDTRCAEGDLELASVALP